MKLSPSLRRRQPAQVYAWTAIMILMLMAVAGLVADGGHLFLQRVALQRTADAAARAGAMEVDLAALRASPEACPRLDARAAQEAAARYLSGDDAIQGRIEANDEAVGVEVRRSVQPTLLVMFGAGPVEIRARAVSEPRAGIEAPRTECGR